MVTIKLINVVAKDFSKVSLLWTTGCKSCHTKWGFQLRPKTPRTNFRQEFEIFPQKQDHCCIYKKSMPAQILHWWIAPKHIKSTFVFLTAIFCQINHLRISPGRVLILLVLNKSWEFQNCTNQPLNIKTAKPMIREQCTTINVLDQKMFS